jgi:putative sterol carrier protein
MGKYFQTEEEVYAVFGAFFEKLLEHPEVGKRLLESHISMKLFLTNPKAEIAVDISGSEGKVITGSSVTSEDVKMTMPADVAHQLWLGKLALMPAIMARQITARGPLEKLRQLGTIFKPATEIYRGTLKELGREDLLT